MVGYDDAYNAKLTRESDARARQHAMNIDRLNGSGKNTKIKGGAVMCPAVYRPVTDPETGKTYSNQCQMSAAKMGGRKCCARCANCKCGSGMSGGAADTPIPAREWFKAEDQAFKRAVAQTITPKNVKANRAEKDLGAGKCGRGTTNVTPQGLTPPAVARVRMNKDLGAGKKFKGGAKEQEEEYYEDDELVGGAAEYEEDEEEYEDGDDCGEMEGGGADDEDGGEEPESLCEMKSICDDYEQKKLTGGAMTKRIRAMLPRGKKHLSVALSKALQKLKRRGRASFARRVQMGLINPAIPPKTATSTTATGVKSTGSGRYVGGAKDHPEIEKIHDSVFGGSKLKGGYGPVAPTTEALAGYDNSNQPKGLKPPPSVNQQSGLRGGALPMHQGYPAEPKRTQKNKGGFAGLEEAANMVARVGRGASGGMIDNGFFRIKGNPMGKFDTGVYPGGDPNFYKRGSGMSGGQPLIPVAQLPSKIGGGKGKMKGGMRTAPNGDYIGPSTGAIIPELQSEVSPAGSGKGRRGARGAMVAKLMKEKGMSLGEASRALKGGAYTANDFFMPRNIHQFFGAYA